VIKKRNLGMEKQRYERISKAFRVYLNIEQVKYKITVYTMKTEENVKALKLVVKDVYTNIRWGVGGIEQVQIYHMCELLIY
jgi:hypothetical protein